MKKIFSFIFAVITLFSLASCGKATPTGAEVITDNGRTEYFAGEAFSIEGFKIRVTYSDGNVSEYDMTKDMLEGEIKFNKPEERSILITYTEENISVSASVTVTVTDPLSVQRGNAVAKINKSASAYIGGVFSGLDVEKYTSAVLASYTSKISTASSAEEISALVDGFERDLEIILNNEGIYGDNGLNEYKVEKIKLLKSTFYSDLEKIKYKLTDQKYNELYDFISEAEYNIILAKTRAETDEVFNGIGDCIDSTQTSIDDIYSAYKLIGAVTSNDECNERITAAESAISTAKTLALSRGVTDITAELQAYRLNDELFNLPELVAAARARHTRLTDAKSDSEGIISKIDAIGNINLGSKPLLDEARNAYDAWCSTYEIDDVNKNLITNFSELTQKEEQFNSLTENAAKDAKAITDAISALGTIKITNDGESKTKLASIDEKINVWKTAYGELYFSTYVETSASNTLEAAKQALQELESKLSFLNEKITLVTDKSDKASIEAVIAELNLFVTENSGITEVVENLSTFNFTAHDVYKKHYLTELINDYQIGTEDIINYSTIVYNTKNTLEQNLAELKAAHDEIVTKYTT